MALQSIDGVPGVHGREAIRCTIFASAESSRSAESSDLNRRMLWNAEARARFGVRAPLSQGLRRRRDPADSRC
jgi:hypothetical protein